MRNTLFALSLLAVFSSRAQTMPLDSFYSPGSSWVEYTGYNYGMSETKVEGKQYTIARDSMIHGYNYHLVASKMLGGYGTQPVVTGIETYYFTDTADFGIIGGVRTAGNRVFFYRTAPDSAAFANTRDFPQDSERLIYDYNVTAGDSVGWQTYNATWGLYNVVRRIDSVYLPAFFYAKTVVFDSGVIGTPSQNYWIEGIGSSVGFLGAHCNNTLWGFMSTHMLCYTTGSFSYKFPNSLLSVFADSCFDVSALTVPDNSRPMDFTFYPNPVTGDQLYFEGRGLQEIRELAILDITGRVVADMPQPFKGGATTIPMALEKGIYIVRVTGADNTVTTRKVVKL